MTCSRVEAKKWIRQNWIYLCDNGQLSVAIKRYSAVYLNGRAKVDEYVKLKNELEKLPIDKPV